MLITGASTGIGRACALRLAGQGWRIFAGVRREQDGAALVSAGGRGGHGGAIEPVTLDVTSEDQIAAARDMIAARVDGGGLQALVNNAGICVVGPVEMVPPAMWRKQFEVNLYGQVAVTQAFLPMLRAAAGARGGENGGAGLPGAHRARIVMMSSIAGVVAKPMMSPYCASKHALEAVADALRLELRAFGIGVSVVEPGSIGTPIWNKGEESAALVPEGSDAWRLYGRGIQGLRRAAERAKGDALPADRVAKVVERCLTARRAPERVIIGRGTKTTARLRRWLPARWFDGLVGWKMRVPR